MNRRPLGLVVAAAGLIITVIGLVGSAADDDSSNVADDDSTVVLTTVTPTTVVLATTPVETAAPTTTMTTVVLATTPVETAAPTTTMTTAAPTTTPVETSAPPTTATPRQVETPAEFVTAFAEALRGGDEEFLLQRIHPEVELRYGRPACEAYLADISDPQFAGELEGSTPEPDWVWETDGKSTPIADAIVAQVVRRAGEPAADVHFAVVDDELRWFTDCGEAIN